MCTLKMASFLQWRPISRGNRSTHALGYGVYGHGNNRRFFQQASSCVSWWDHNAHRFRYPRKRKLNSWIRSLRGKTKISAMDYGFHMAITKWDEAVSKDMEVMVEDKGINSFKFFMAYKGSLMINDDLFLEGFKKCKSLGALAMVHAENGDAVFEGQKRMIELGIVGPEGHALSRPPQLEGEATGRAIRLAGFMNTPPLYVVHVMSIDAMEEVPKARKSGQKVIGEPVVSGLVLDDTVLWDSDFQTAAN
ncbi:hypothetical protein ABFX02_04G078600 [Erythranthe guttata]